jgi:nucleotide-binding universal stress UspA family protein
MFKHILLPTDGSPASERAALAGVSFAKEVGAEIVALHVIPPFHTFTLDTEMLEDTEEEYARVSVERAEKYLGFVADAARAAGVPCSTEKVVADEPYEAILDTARHHHSDLIIMASHGRRGIKALLLGSETQKVLVHSGIPVLVFR